MKTYTFTLNELTALIMGITLVMFFAGAFSFKKTALTEVKDTESYASKAAKKAKKEAYHEAVETAKRAEKNIRTEGEKLTAAHREALQAYIEGKALRGWNTPLISIKSEIYEANQELIEHILFNTHPRETFKDSLAKYKISYEITFNPLGGNQDK